VTDHLVGAFEIAGILGVSRQRVHQLAVTSGFPAPLADLASGKVWERSAIEEWARRTGRMHGDGEG
jgi:prophage regulatory protein